MKKSPNLRFTEFSGEWEEKKLGELLELKNGINASKEQYGKGIKFINVLDILNNNYITYDNIIGKVDIDQKTLENNFVEYGDVLFQRSSETREEVGTANVYLDKEKKAVFGGFVIRGKKIGEYEPIFINKILKTPVARKEITSRSGGSTRYNVGQEILKNIELLFPSQIEQQKIARFLSLIDKKIEKQQEKVKALEEYKKGIVKKIFLQEIRFKNENGVEYPEWKENQLGDIVAFFDNKRKPVKEQDRVNGKYAYYGATGIIDYINEYIFEGEYLLLGEDGANIVTRNAPLIYKTSGKFWVNNHAHIFRPKEMYNIDYIKQILEIIDYVPYNTGTAQPKLNIESVKKIKIKTPVIDEQEKIAYFLSKVENKFNKEKEKLEQLKELKKGLLQQMFV